jgi:endo-1,4-beta-xylanase
MDTRFTGHDSQYKDIFYCWDVVNEVVSDGIYKIDNDRPKENLLRDIHGGKLEC